MNFFKKFKKLFGFLNSEDFNGQITDRSVKWMFDYLDFVRTEIFQLIEPTHEVQPLQSLSIPKLLAEFGNAQVGIVHGQGTGHAFIRVDMLKEIMRTYPNQIHNYATLVELFRKRGFIVKRISYFSVMKK